MEWNDMITAADMTMLQRLSEGPMAAPVMEDDEIKRVLRLVDMGLVRDYSAFAGHRMPVRLRIWGINDRGKAVVEQRALTEAKRSPQLTLDHPS
jgi:hypothetical protein